MSRHQTHRIHENSTASWKALDQVTRADEVMRAYDATEEPMTDRQVAQHLGYADMNAVRPIITKLLDSGDLEQCGNRKDAHTNRTVRTCQRSPFL